MKNGCSTLCTVPECNTLEQQLIGATTNLDTMLLYYCNVCTQRQLIGPLTTRVLPYCVELRVVSQFHPPEPLHEIVDVCVVVSVSEPLHP